MTNTVIINRLKGPVKSMVFLFFGLLMPSVYASSGLNISPYAYLFGNTDLNSATLAKRFTIKNTGSRTLNIQASSLAGANQDHFIITLDNCSAQALVLDASCDIHVSFKPKSIGSKSAVLSVTTDDPDNPKVNVFLRNHEADEEESERRLPPVLNSFSIEDSAGQATGNMLPNTQYTFKWSILGYHKSYTSLVVMFDCTGIADNTSCGNSFSDDNRILSSGSVFPNTSTNGNWFHGNIQSKVFNYSYTFTTPNTASSTPIVIRFYRKNNKDLAAGNGSLSLIIPGNQAENYYDTTGRRIKGTIVPSLTSDADNDTIPYATDNCPSIANTNQLNTDGDLFGDACDSDDDNDTISDVDEVNAGTNPLLADTDADNVDDNEDDFPLDPNKVATVEKAHRLLTQATFGATLDEINRVVSIGAKAWINEELAKNSAYDTTSDLHLTHLERTIQITLAAEPTINWYSAPAFNQGEAGFNVDDYQMAAWWENSLGLHPTNQAHGSDQLRQRVAYALSQLLVTSNTEPPLARRGESLAFYYDLLAKHALGNFRDLLGEVARSPTMGIFLSHQGNKKANVVAGTRPDENFAREVMQLFSVGLYELNLDGSPNRDANPASYPDAGESLIPTYDQKDIEELAKVMTGWDLVGNTHYGNRSNRQGDYTQLMEFTASEHEDEVALGGDGNVTVLGQTFALNAGADQSGMDAALDVLFNHPNVAPYVSHHLIIRLVTSNPSSDYVARVASVFNDNGNGVRGDLKAVTKALLTDEEARGDAYQTIAHFGKAKEPMLAWTQMLRALNAKPLDGWKGKDKTTLVSGVYWYRAPQKQLGQAPMRSPSVFNFYSPDYISSDGFFANNSLVNPELQIQTDQILVEINNRVYRQLDAYEKNRITILDGKTLSEFAATKGISTDSTLVDFTPQLQLFEQALDGDTNGDFANMENTDTDGIRFKAKAVDALITHLDLLLMGNTLTDEFKLAMQHYLVDSNATKNSNDAKEARNVVRDAVRFIVTSSSYMTQK